MEEAVEELVGRGERVGLVKVRLFRPRGPAWSNSLFEDNAEFGLGMRVALDQQRERERALVELPRPRLSDGLAAGLLEADQSSEAGIGAQRRRVAQLRADLRRLRTGGASRLAELADALVRRSVWMVGDGWAYDIGFGGLDHVLSSGREVNVLVLDTEVYSNTGGQASKATPRGAVAKFAAAGKRTRKKDLGQIASAYGDVYVAQVAIGADNQQTITALAEAEAHPGPSMVIAYSHRIAHGIDMATGMTHQGEAVKSGYWPLYRFIPEWDARGEHPFVLDSRDPVLTLSGFADRETRFSPSGQLPAEEASRLRREAQHDVDARWRLYRQLGAIERDDG